MNQHEQENAAFHEIQKHLVECDLSILDCETCKKVYGEKRPKELERKRLGRLARKVLDERPVSQR